MDNGFVHVHDTVAALLVVAEGMVAEGEVARIIDRLLRRALAHFQRGQRHERLEGRAGRVGTVDRTVDHRLVGVLVQLLPVLRCDAVHEQVGVVGRGRHQGKDTAGAGVDGDQGAFAIAEGLFGDFLQFDVERQLQVVAGDRRDALQAAQGAAAGVDLDLLVAGLAVQFEFVMLLQAGLADMVSTLVVGQLLGVLDPLQVALGDAADVADGVRGDMPHRILAEQAGLDLDAREAIALGRELGDFGVAQAGADGDGLEILGFVEQAFEALAILGLDVDDFGQRIDGFIELSYLGRGDFQREGRIVVGQHHAIAVGDDAAIGHDGNQRDAVVFGARLVEIMLDDLQPDEAADQDAEADENEGGGKAEPETEPVEVGFRIVEITHVRSASDRTVRILIDRSVLRQKQDEGGRNPQQGRHNRADEIAPAREIGANRQAHQSLDHLGPDEQGHDLQGLLGEREPQDAPG